MINTDLIIKKRSKAHQRYRLADGTIVPGVTTILDVMNKPALVKWANNLGLQGIDSSAYVDETAKIGTLAHEMVQEYLGGPEWDRSTYNAGQIDLAENAVLSFFEWERRNVSSFETVFIEKQFVSETNRYGGTVDWYGELDGQMWLVDFKTCKALFPEHTYQTAAYWALLLEHGYRVDGVRILRIGRSEDEGFDDKIIGREEIEDAYRVFESALNLYRAKSSFERRCK